MFSYIKRHWPVYVILTLIAIALGFGAAYIVGAKGSTRFFIVLAVLWDRPKASEP